MVKKNLMNQTQTLIYIALNRLSFIHHLHSNPLTNFISKAEKQ